jgi:hypothetical protein
MRILWDTTGEQVLKQQNSTGKAQEILNYMFALHVVSCMINIYVQQNFIHFGR